MNSVMYQTANNTKSIKYGDKIFAQITQNGKTIYNFVTEKVSSITDVIMEVRRLLHDVKGLVVLHIRNYNAGWGGERPLMLYGSTNSSYGLPKANSKVSNHTPQRQMLFPWETH